MKEKMVENRRNFSFEDFSLPEFDFTGNQISQNSSIKKIRHEGLEIYETEQYRNLRSSVIYARFAFLISFMLMLFFINTAREVVGLPLDPAFKKVIYRVCGALSLISFSGVVGACASGIYYLIQMGILLKRNTDNG